MNKRLVLIIGFLGSSLLNGCVQVSEEIKPLNKKNNLAVSSARDYPMSFPEKSIFTLSPKYLSDNPVEAEQTSFKTEQTKVFYSLYANAIISDLVKHGFEKNDVNQTSAFHVEYSLALDSDLSDITINEKFGVLPGLPKSEGLNKGSLLIYIKDSLTGNIVWRGAAQGFIHYELLPTEQAQRAENIVNKIMSQFYATN